MIVPRTRLILWVSVIVLPFAALAGTMPAALSVSAFAIGALYTASNSAWLRGMPTTRYGVWAWRKTQR